MPDNSKILLLLDNCPAHPPPKELETKNVFVKHLPPNCTSVLQPMDMGVLRALKCHYKRYFVRELLHFVNSDDSVASFIKQYTIKDAIWNIALSWEKISHDTLKNAWHNLWPATLFLDDDDDSEFEGFPSKKDDDVRELMDYVKSVSSGKINLDEDDLFELVNIDNDAPIINKLTDDEILNSVISPTQENSESEEEDSQQIEEKIPINTLISAVETTIKGLEQRSFITQSEILTMYKIKDKLLNAKPKLLRQKTLKEMFL
jgi:hypothetical protein